MVEENFMQSLYTLLLGFGDKNELLNALLTCTFIPPLLSLELRKKALRLLLTCLEALEEGFSSFLWRNWEGFTMNLFSLGKLYQRI